MDISALASMKNVAKCDTWCELQNPVNHRVFERKLRPKPFGRGHACLGVTYRVAPHQPAPRACGAGADIGLPRSKLGWPKCKPRGDQGSRQAVVDNLSALVASCPSVPLRAPNPQRATSNRACIATPGQAGLPAEFKHINKRRKRNLQGFP